ncbi:MAG: hypothetical protein WBO19_08400, partial [Terriglobia bacterium]
PPCTAALPKEASARVIPKTHGKLRNARIEALLKARLSHEDPSMSAGRHSQQRRKSVLYHFIL